MSVAVSQPCGLGLSSSSAGATAGPSCAHFADPRTHASHTLAEERVRNEAAVPIISLMSCIVCQRRPLRLRYDNVSVDTSNGSLVSPRDRSGRGRVGVSSYNDQYPSVEDACLRHSSISSDLRKALVLSYGPDRGQDIRKRGLGVSRVRLLQRGMLIRTYGLRACPASTTRGMEVQSATCGLARVPIKVVPFGGPLPFPWRRPEESSPHRHLCLSKRRHSATFHHEVEALKQLQDSEEGYHHGESSYVGSSSSEEVPSDSVGAMAEQGAERIAGSGSEASERGRHGRGDDLRDGSNTSLGYAGETFEGRRYHLRVVQQPVTGCAFGRDQLSRLAVQPPLIVQLRVTNTDDEEVDFDDELPFLICRLSLTTEDGAPADLLSGTPSPTPLGPRHSTGTLLERTVTLARQQRTASATEPQRMLASCPSSGSGTPLSSPPSTALSMLYGTLVASPVQLPNQQQRLRTFFVFPEVSIRGRGRFRINAAVMRMPLPTSEQVSASTDVVAAPSIRGAMLAAVFTEPFDVVAYAEYVAPYITELTRHFAANGVGLLLPPNQTSNE